MDTVDTGVRTETLEDDTEGCPNGEVAWFCSACMASFCLPQGETPAACPEGHLREVADELASPAGDKEACASD